MSATKKSWRDVYPVHPAADVFPMMNEDDLRKLGEDIERNGMLWPIITTPVGEKTYVIDGRNRLDAMELVGVGTIGSDGELESRSLSLIEDDVAGWVISANIRRRHLTKEQQADLIVAVVSSGTLAKVAKVSGKRGPAKDAVKAKVTEEAKKQGVSKRTAERALAKSRGAKSDAPTRTFVTCPECSKKTADLDKHMSTNHPRAAAKLAKRAATNDPSAKAQKWLDQLEAMTQGISEGGLPVETLDKLAAAARAVIQACERSKRS